MTGGRQYTGQRRQVALSGARLSQAGRAAAAAVSAERLQADIERLAGFGPRHGGGSPEAHRAAAAWIEAEMRSADCEVETQRFDIPSQEPQRAGTNVIGRLAGTDTRRAAVLIGAHFDTVPGSPGADDNASGVAVMLECARVLAALPRRAPVIFAAFDAEEKQPPVEGLHGSTAYVRSLAELGPVAAQVSAAYILEMVGFSAPAGAQKVPPGFQLLFPRAFDMLRSSGFAGDSVVVLTDGRSRGLGRGLEQAAAAAATVGNGLKVLPLELPGWMRVPYNLRRSDHAPFWQEGVPAVMIGDTANFRNPHYHRSSDTPDTLDYGLIAHVARTLAARVAEEAR